MTTAAPEPLRLFADSPGAAREPSLSEVDPAASALRTRRSVTKWLIGEHEEALRGLARSAGLLRQAELRFDRSVRDARQLGHTWRVIGKASWVPYQSLHRRFAQPNTKAPQQRRPVSGSREG